MRAKSERTNGFIIYAVSGTNTVVLAVDFFQACTKGLLGFTVERIHQQTGKREFLKGLKKFKGESDSAVDTNLNSYNDPIQSFLWSDYSCDAGTTYQYLFYPVTGKPDRFERTSDSISVTITTESVFQNEKHDVFFNRGVVSSQAYSQKFSNRSPAEITDPTLQKEAFKWLSRDLETAILSFIDNARCSETLLCCFYEFSYLPVAEAFKKAIENGVKVKLIIDGKNNQYTDRKGKFHQSTPRTESLKTLKEAGIPDDCILKREARKEALQHNKFMILLDSSDVPNETWTGSVNMTLGGIFGQTNVGHWIRDTEVAARYFAYWKLLSTDPGATESDNRQLKLKKDRDYKKAVTGLSLLITPTNFNRISLGTIPVFSPQTDLTVLKSYVGLFNSAEKLACITFPFGINSFFKTALQQNTVADHLSFLLLDKPDDFNRQINTFTSLGAEQNVYQAWGAAIDHPLYRWTKEVTTRDLKLNVYVPYIHAKFMLVDPLGSCPVVITGSANFSGASTISNDENMLIIKGNKRVADIYFTEFNRLFFHYYFRDWHDLDERRQNTKDDKLTLIPDDSWIKRFEKGKLGYKLLQVYLEMTLT